MAAQALAAAVVHHSLPVHFRCHAVSPKHQPDHRRAAFSWAYEATGRSPSAPGLWSRLTNLLASGRAVRPTAGGAPTAGAAADGGRGGSRAATETQPEDLFDAEDLKALQALSGALRRAGVTID